MPDHTLTCTTEYTEAILFFNRKTRIIIFFTSQRKYYAALNKSCFFLIFNAKFKHLQQFMRAFTK